MKFTRMVFTVLLAAALPLFIAHPADATTYTWSAFGAGDWFQATNWTPNGVPGPGDTAVIKRLEGPSANAPVTVGEIDLSALDTMGGAGTITVTNLFNFTDAVLQGSGKLEIPSGALLRFQTTHFYGGEGIFGSTIDIMGNAVWTGSGNISLGTGAGINNLGTFDIQADGGAAGTDVGIYGFGEPFTNTGTLTKSAGAGIVKIGLDFSNQGVTIVKSGTLEFDEGGQHSGAFQADGGNFDFATGTYMLSASSSITGTGSVSFSSANVVDDGVYNITGTTSITGGSVTFTRPFVNTTQLDVSSTLNTAGGFMQSSGGTALDGGSVISANGITIGGGSVTGTGTLNGPVTNNGALTPGTPIQLGDLMVMGSLTEMPNGVINIQIGDPAAARGRQAAAASDFVNVSGAAHLGGTLNVTIPTGTAVSNVKVMSYNSQDGGFANILGVAAPYRVAVGPNDVRVTSDPTGSLSAGVRMVSVPYDFSASGQTAADLFQVSPLSDGAMPIATWDPTKPAYAYYPQLPGTQPQPGRGYWIELSAAKTITAVGNPVSSPFTQTLSPGWNMIGDPFPTAVNVSTLQFSAGVAVGSNPANTSLSFASASSGGLVNSTVYGYSGSGYAAATTLQPYNGYWIYIDPATSQHMPVQVTFTRGS